MTLTVAYCLQLYPALHNVLNHPEEFELVKITERMTAVVHK